MIKKPHQDQNRDGILRTLTRFGSGRLPMLGGNANKPYVAPSRERRKPLGDLAFQVELVPVLH